APAQAVSEGMTGKIRAISRLKDRYGESVDPGLWEDLRQLVLSGPDQEGRALERLKANTAVHSIPRTGTACGACPPMTSSMTPPSPVNRSSTAPTNSSLSSAGPCSGCVTVMFAQVAASMNRPSKGLFTYVRGRLRRAAAVLGAIPAEAAPGGRHDRL